MTNSRIALNSANDAGVGDAGAPPDGDVGGVSMLLNTRCVMRCAGGRDDDDAGVRRIRGGPHHVRDPPRIASDSARASRSDARRDSPFDDKASARAIDRGMARGTLPDSLQYRGTESLIRSISMNH